MRTSDLSCHEIHEDCDVTSCIPAERINATSCQNKCMLFIFQQKYYDVKLFYSG